MSLRGGEMGSRLRVMILNVLALVRVHLCEIRADEDGIDMQDGAYRICRKKRTPEIAGRG